jgi:uncharacterized repeat protein (TIGR03847 family)
MPRRIFSFDPPDRFLAGTVGSPGRRTFYLQAVKGLQVISVALEKVQVAVLAERLTAFVAAIRDSGSPIAGGTTDSGTPIADRSIAGAEAIQALGQPVIEQFRVGTLALAWDPGREVIMVEARAMGEEDEDEPSDDEEDGAEDEAEVISDDDPDGPDILRVRVSAAVALEFARHALRVVAAGRPPCPMCGQPLNPEGHLCPRRNGYVH